MNGELVGVVQRVGHHDLDRGRVAGAPVRAARRPGGVALVAVRADQREPYAHGAGTDDRLAGPDVVAEADDPAVQAVRSVVDRDGVLNGPDSGLVQGEFAVGDPVAVPADGLAEVDAGGRGHRRAVELDVVGQGLEAEHHVGRLAVATRHPDVLDDRAVGDDLDAHAAVVAERVPEYGQVVAGVLIERGAEERPADAQGGCGRTGARRVGLGGRDGPSDGYRHQRGQADEGRPAETTLSFDQAHAGLPS